MAIFARDRVRAGLLFAAALGVAACAGPYMEGMELADMPPANPSATYMVTECRDVATGAKVVPPTLTYYLQPTGPSFVLYEFDPQRHGARMTNHWYTPENDADNFFSYASVANSGFRFLIPRNRTLPGQRLVYAGGQFESALVNGAVQIIGTPYNECVMVPAQGNPAPAPPPPAAAVVPPGGCVRDAECPVGSICEGGACVPNKAAEPDPSTWECKADNNCPQGRLCYEHKCIREMPCQTDKECQGQDICDAGVCIPTSAASDLFKPDPLCTADDQCREGRACREGKCQDGEPDRFQYKVPGGGDGAACKVDVDCPGRQVCHELLCQRKVKR
jgi:hypothetical protein